MPKEDFYSWLEQFYSQNNVLEHEKADISFLEYFEYKNYIFSDTKFVVFADMWQRKPEIIKSKVSSLYKKNRRIYGRECKVSKIEKDTANNFLDENHIYGSSLSKTNYGLYYKSELCAIASFAAQRKFESGKSAELLRFCNKNFVTVVGGLSKLINYYARERKPADIMTYADKDWGAGEAFIKLGFEEAGHKDGISFFCNTKTHERIAEKYFSDFVNINDYVFFKNSGSLKLIKKII